MTVRRPVAVSPVHTFSPEQSELVTLPDGGTGVNARQRTGAGGILLQSGWENRGSQNPEPSPDPARQGAVSRTGPAGERGGPAGRRDRGAEVRLRQLRGSRTGAFTVQRAATAPETTALIGTPDRVTVATYNVLNLSPTPSDSAQMRLLGRQIVERLRSPDILALEEIQDESGEADDGTTSGRGTLEALAGAISAAGGPRYAFFEVAPADGRPGGAPGGNIRNAFLYNPDRVRLVSHRSLTPAVLGSVGARDSLAFQGSRDPLEGVFELRGRQLRIVGNHLSSRFGSTPVFGAVQPFVQAGEVKRGAQVRALHDYAARLLAAEPGARLVALGDHEHLRVQRRAGRAAAGLAPGAPRPDAADAAGGPVHVQL